MAIPVEEAKDDSSKLLQDMYVHDVTTYRSLAQVKMMLGLKLPNCQFTGTILLMAGKVGLKLKTMVASGSQDDNAI